MTSARSTPRGADSRSRVLVLNRQRRNKIHPKAVESFCAGMLRALKHSPRALSVVFVGARRMRELNRRYRGRDYATDVLSFSYGSEMMDGLAILGEIVVAPEIAWQQARRWQVRPDREMRKLLLHGILHLLGYDHETDNGEMNRLQTRLMRRPAFSPSAPLMRRKNRK